jgi:hypothetical protein
MFLIGCTETKVKIETIEKDGWKSQGQVIKTLKNVNFTFPEKGFAFDKKEEYIRECFDAIRENLAIIELSEFNEPIYIRFLSSREESGIYTGQKSSGSAWPYMKTLYVVANENQKPPIKHEMMHLMSMLEWGYENPTSQWVNEGLGTFAGNNCNGYNVAQIYRYLMEADKLIPIELLASDFYGQSEMIGYHQAAYIVEYLLSKYSVGQLKKLWIAGFGEFEEIYGLPFSSIKGDLEKVLLEKYPKAPEIDWEQFDIGCE